MKKSAFKQGLFSNVLNPKVAMFFLTFLRPFIKTGAAATQQLIIMGVIYTVLSITWFFVYVFFINYLREWLMFSESPSPIRCKMTIKFFNFKSSNKHNPVLNLGRG
ncbi:LysE family translocator [Bacillus rhizoplanae]|uniref:LysE family translocator n=1 Tax=Bacillus rhizoplanae TaxID=2880966 RepID=UPI003D1DA2B4